MENTHAKIEYLKALALIIDTKALSEYAKAQYTHRIVDVCDSIEADLKLDQEPE